MTRSAPRVELTRVYHFSAGHRLENPALDAEANARLYGPCFRPHGHNYYVEVTVAGVPDALTGMAVDLGQVDALVTERLLAHVDHRTLEEVALLRGVVSTGEGLARAFWDVLVPALDGRLVRVAVVETAKNRFEYHGETET
ncbi:MAG: 6-carboxytetrahydropterin synthase [Candidatus Rokubacteria bacterium]|nr:6-carboxytetrahydropterin synthase [Candidatus Rokubacteria bacterium]